MTSEIERAAFAIYSTFIAGAVGTCRQKKDQNGKPIWLNGKPVRETPEEAALRRWTECPELTRERFRVEARAALEAV